MKRSALFFILIAVACSKSEQPSAEDIEKGRQLTGQYGCNVCHQIPSVEGMQGSMGPSLAGVAARPTISNGKVQNTPGNLAKFIQNPPSLNPSSTMPALNMPMDEAKQMAAFLRTLK